MVTGTTKQACERRDSKRRDFARDHGTWRVGAAAPVGSKALGSRQQAPVAQSAVIRGKDADTARATFLLLAPKAC